MARLAAIGEWSRVRGFALAGALVVDVDDAASVQAAWASLPADVEVVVLTPPAARAVDAGGLPTGSRLLRVVLP